MPTGAAHSLMQRLGQRPPFEGGRCSFHPSSPVPSLLTCVRTLHQVLVADSRTPCGPVTPASQLTEASETLHRQCCTHGARPPPHATPLDAQLGVPSTHWYSLTRVPCGSVATPSSPAWTMKSGRHRAPKSRIRREITSAVRLAWRLPGRGGGENIAVPFTCCHLPRLTNRCVRTHPVGGAHGATARRLCTAPAEHSDAKSQGCGEPPHHQSSPLAVCVIFFRATGCTRAHVLRAIRL